MMAEMEKLDIQFLSEIYIISEEENIKEEVGSREEDRGRNRGMMGAGDFAFKCMDFCEVGSKEALSP